MARLRSLDEERGIVDVEAGIEWAELLAGPRCAPGRSAAAVGDSPEADRLRQPLRRRRARVERPRPWAPPGADRRRRRGVHACRRPRRRARGRSGDQTGPVPARHRRLRAVRRRDVGSASPVAPARSSAATSSLIRADELIDAFDERIADGYTFGDCQFSIDEQSDDFLNLGIFSCYRPVDEADIDSGRPAGAVDAGVGQAAYLTHVDRAGAATAYIDALPRHVRPALLVRSPPAERVHRQLPPAARSGDRR